MKKMYFAVLSVVLMVFSFAIYAQSEKESDREVKISAFWEDRAALHVSISDEEKAFEIGEEALSRMEEVEECITEYFIVKSVATDGGYVAIVYDLIGEKSGEKPMIIDVYDERLSVLFVTFAIADEGEDYHVLTELDSQKRIDTAVQLSREKFDRPNDIDAELILVCMSGIALGL